MKDKLIKKDDLDNSEVIASNRKNSKFGSSLQKGKSNKIMSPSEMSLDEIFNALPPKLLILLLSKDFPKEEILSVSQKLLQQYILFPNLSTSKADFFLNDQKRLFLFKEQDLIQDNLNPNLIAREYDDKYDYETYLDQVKEEELAESIFEKDLYEEKQDLDELNKNLGNLLISEVFDLNKIPVNTELKNVINANINIPFNLLFDCKVETGLFRYFKKEILEQISDFLLNTKEYYENRRIINFLPHPSLRININHLFKSHYYPINNYVFDGILEKDLDKYILSNRILRNIEDINIELGTINCLMGLNGSGKTTFFKVLVQEMDLDCIFVKITSDSKTVLEFNNAFDDDFFNKMNYVSNNFQRLIHEDNLYEQNRTILKNINWSHLMQDSNYDSIFAGKDMKYLLSIFNLFSIDERFFKQPFNTYSSGMAQKVFILSLLSSRRKIVCLDEPFNALDKNAVLNLKKLMKYLSTEHGLTFIFTTHTALDIAEIADKVFVLRSGRKVIDIDVKKEAKYFKFISLHLTPLFVNVSTIINSELAREFKFGLYSLIKKVVGKYVPAKYLIFSFEDTFNANDFQFLMKIHKDKSLHLFQILQSDFFHSILKKGILGISLEVSGIDYGFSLNCVKRFCEASL